MPFAVLALPDKEREANRWSLEAPNLLSFLSFHTMKGRVPGLREFPPQDRPPVGLPFYAFGIMVLIGFVMLFMTLWALGKWLGGGLPSAGHPDLQHVHARGV